MKISSLQWDDINVEHIMGRHGLRPEEVEDVCFGPHVAYPAKYHRKVIYGKTSGGKYLMLILERLYGTVFRPITGRGMKRDELRKYRTIMGQRGG